MKGIKDRVAFVTGGENGLGQAIAEAFAKAGAKVVIFGIDEEKGPLVAQELNAITEGAMFIKGNVVSNNDLAHAMQIIKKEYGQLDFAINNAGITDKMLPFMETPIEQFDRIVAVNFKGIFQSMQNEIALMTENAFGRVVNVSSEAGFVGFERFSAYVATKHAVNGLTKAVALEQAQNGITVNAIAPGTMKTPLVAALSAEDQKALAAIRPTNRLIELENVAAQALFLCSDYGKDTVGAIWAMDGGNTAQ